MGEELNAFIRGQMTVTECQAKVFCELFDRKGEATEGFSNAAVTGSETH